jgi:hypothetical protein
MALADDDVRYTFERELPLRLPTGAPVRLQAQQLTVAAEVELLATLALAEWQRLQAAGACGLQGCPAELGFEPGLRVRLRLRLQAAQAGRFDTADALLQALLGEPEGPLRDAACWQALEAVQRLDVPGVPGGWTEIGWQRAA